MRKNVDSIKQTDKQWTCKTVHGSEMQTLTACLKRGNVKRGVSKVDSAKRRLVKLRLLLTKNAIAQRRCVKCGLLERGFIQALQKT